VKASNDNIETALDLSRYHRDMGSPMFQLVNRGAELEAQFEYSKELLGGNVFIRLVLIFQLFYYSRSKAAVQHSFSVANLTFP
jgi:hypothetical protein